MKTHSNQILPNPSPARTLPALSALGALLCFAIAGCSSGSGDPSGPGGTESDVGSEPEFSSGISSLSGPRFGEAEGDEKLAEITVGPTHSIVFWREASGVVSVLEGYNVDVDRSGPRLEGFSARRDSYAELFQELGGDAVDPAAHVRLAAIDAEREKAGTLVRGQRLAPLERLIPKTVQEDIDWFAAAHCRPRMAAFPGFDVTRCWVAPLTPVETGQTWTWNLSGYEELNIALFNAHTTAWANLFTSGITCSGIFGPCTGLRTRTMDVQPRFVWTLKNTADNGFRTTATGKAYALHYLFYS